MGCNGTVGAHRVQRHRGGRTGHVNGRALTGPVVVAPGVPDMPVWAVRCRAMLALVSSVCWSNMAVGVRVGDGAWALPGVEVW